MKIIHYVAFVLVIVGALNWLVFGLTNGWDIGQLFGGMDSIISRIIYVLVGISAIWLIVTHKSTCHYCKSESISPQM